MITHICRENLETNDAHSTFYSDKIAVSSAITLRSFKSSVSVTYLLMHKFDQILAA